jgi:HPt (histidine-containing phosphotransfer) domain-containing protein
MEPGQVRLDDLLRVCSSEGHINRELLKEMLVLFIQENERRVRETVAAAAAGDTSELRAVVHAIKGSAGLIGAEHLHDLASDFELRIVSGTIKSPVESARGLSDEFAAVVETLRARYPDLCPEASNGPTDPRVTTA